MGIKAKIFLVCTFGLLLVGPVQPILAHDSVNRNRSQQSESQFQQLRQLGNWLSQNRVSELEDWVKARPSEAMALLREVVVDVYASPWIGIKPMYPASEALLPVLARLLKQPAVLDRACGWHRSRTDYWSPEPTEDCHNAPGAQQLEMLRTLLALVQRNRVAWLPSPEGPVSSSFVYDPRITEPWSERAHIQRLLLENLQGTDYQGRVDKLTEALGLAKGWQAYEMEGSLMLALARVYAEASVQLEPQFKPLLTPKQAELQANKWFEQVETREQAHPSSSLKFRLHLFRAKQGQHLMLAEAALTQVPAGVIHQRLELELADGLMIVKGDLVKGFGIYRRLLKEGDKDLRLDVMARLIHIQERQDLMAMRQAFEQEKDPDLLGMLVQVFPLLDQGPELFRHLQLETNPKLRLIMANTLGNSYQEKGDEYRDFRLLQPLLQDADPAVRWEVASALAKIDEPAYQALVLSWIDCHDAPLLTQALSEVHNRNRRDLLSKVKGLLTFPDESIQAQAVMIIQDWGGIQDLPVLEAALPKARGYAADALRLLIARYKGSDAWLAELLRQNQKPVSYDALAQLLKDGMKDGLLTRAQVEALQKQPNAHIRDQATKALESMNGYP